ncbi:hypothetical protein TIFTF001_009568 [Ficus carica]|uniref:RNase H type-1 domain-containing protein n=1 Tax=Ficus carica TaxID=3494 RepID=A0AA88D3Q4_FICCA|nr:hypothetical protein TIFTF001_009568 [Ficus carica]
MNMIFACGRGIAITMKDMLEAAYPGINVILANHPPALLNRLLSKAVPVVQVGITATIMAGEQIFPRFGIMTPPPCHLYKVLAPLKYIVMVNSSAFRFLDTPSERLAKTNVDAAYQTGVDFIGVGAIAQNSKGVVLACLAKKLEGCICPYEAECLALGEGLEFAKACLRIALAETDANRMVQLVAIAANFLAREILLPTCSQDLVFVPIVNLLGLMFCLCLCLM